MMMKRWMFVVGLVACSLLFFISGTLTGYLYCERSFAKTARNRTKNPRKPSAVPGNLFLKRIIETKTMNMRNKIRQPRIAAVEKAQQYKSELQ